MKKFIVLISAFFMLNSSIAVAGDDVYFKLSGLITNLATSDVEFQGAKVGEIKTDYGFGVSVAAGKNFGNAFAEIEYAHRKVDVDSARLGTLDVTDFVEDDISSDLLMANIGYEFGKKYKPYILAGLGMNWVDEMDGAEFAYQLGAGIAQPLNDHFGIFVGYKYLGSLALDDDVLNDVTYEFDSHNFEAGIKYSF